MAVIHSLKNTGFISTGDLAVTYLSYYFSSGVFIPKNVGASYALFQRYHNYFYRRLAATYSFNDTVYFSDVKICHHNYFC